MVPKGTPHKLAWLNRERLLRACLPLAVFWALGFLFSEWTSAHGPFDGLQEGSIQHSGQSLFDTFVAEGIEVVPGVRQPLAPPLLGESHSLDQRREKLEELTARHGWERFSRVSVMAPVHVELGYIYDDSNQRVGHSIYSAFIGYVDLSALRDRDLMESLFGTPSNINQQDHDEQIGFDPNPLPEELLTRVGIEKHDQDKVRYSGLRLPLMNRIVLLGSARIERMETESSILVAWQFDPQFAYSSPDEVDPGFEKFMNHYVKTQRDNLGREILSPPVPYSGCGGYVSVQSTGLQPRQMLFESRMVLHEPSEWFAGSNFLRSKFPAVLQESAQNFRRKIQELPDSK